ncbi:bifunctional nuclease family protein [Corynebacterium uropygiale]|uniref:Bifunctional nuclease family protein n=1 Tax=Corynebacterium uropygiale TaxID=1775911 RepID=A0A9X1QQR7_9CORY|nr:bifunctional nuclease family protein [Corynebacterium uropygiale]MCF4006692.1 bifunctional nuclease family protein [Corynebacterium uropygiale]
MGSVPVTIHGVHEVGPEGFACAIIEGVGDNRIIPVWLNPADAMLLDVRLRGMGPRRPTTHDLLVELVQAQGGIAESVIDSYHQGVFSATITLNSGESLDARASDAIMLSILTDTPLAVDEDVISQTSLYLSPDDLRTYLGIDGFHHEDDPHESSSASGDAQADADFQSFMQSMGVTESDLTGSREENDDDVTGESQDEDGEY